MQNKQKRSGDIYVSTTGVTTVCLWSGNTSGIKNPSTNLQALILQQKRHVVVIGRNFPKLGHNFLKGGRWEIHDR